MPRTAGKKVERSFNKGLITESTGLNFPVDSCTETYNCVFSERGRVSRRKGIEYEVDANTFTVDRTGGVVSEFYWQNAGDGSTNIIVVQIGQKLHFYRENLIASLSAQKLATVIDLNTYVTGVTADIKKAACSFAPISGKLFVANPQCNPIYLTYNVGVNTISASAIIIKIRDQTGDTTDANYANVTTRPVATVGTVGSAHMYNLYNQGWALPVFNIAGTTINPVTHWDNVLTTIPSNADVWFLYKDATEKFDPVNFADRTSVGNTQAPRGYYILPAFATDRSTQSGFAGVTETTSGGLRPRAIAAFAGRIWYAGVDASGYAQNIYYSQIIVNGTEYGNCYQQEDPTSEAASDLLASDGGVLSIPEVGKVIKMFPMQSSLLVFGTNGVWSLSGSQGLGFSANDYSVVKVSATPAYSALSFVDVYGIPVWWNTEGIFTIQTDQISGVPAAKSLSDSTIKTLISSIHPDAKYYVKGVFNQYDKTIQWLYRSSNTASLEDSFVYDRALNLNTLTSAFYPWTLPTANPYINGLIVSRGPYSAAVNETVTKVDLTTVTTLDGSIVNALNYSVQNPNFSIRYITTKYDSGVDWDLTFSQAQVEACQDWGTNGVLTDYSSYFFTQYQLDGDATVYFQNNYIVAFLEKISNASCFFEAWWEYTNTSSNGLVSNAQQLYPTTNLASTTLQRKLKVRGRGRVVQFKFTSESGKPFAVTGWGIWSTQNAQI